MGKDPTDLEPIGAVEREVDALRARTERLIEELERRIEATVGTAKRQVGAVRHAVDLRARARERPRAIAGIGAGAAVALGAGVWLALRRRQAQGRPMARMRRRAHAWRLLLGHPERVTHEPPSLWRKLMFTALTAAVGTLVRKMTEYRANRIGAPLLTGRSPNQL